MASSAALARDYLEDLDHLEDLDGLEVLAPRAAAADDDAAAVTAAVTALGSGATAAPPSATEARTAAASPPAVVDGDSDALAWAELCARYPDQWVVLADLAPTFTGAPDDRSGKLIDHQPSRRATDAAVRSARTRHRTVDAFWTGDPEDLLPWPPL